MKIIRVACLILVGMLIGGFSIAALYKEVLNKKYLDSRFEDGRLSGVRSGYDVGFKEGNQKGISLGYDTGYSKGWNDNRERLLKLSVSSNTTSQDIQSLLGTPDIVDQWDNDLMSGSARIGSVWVYGDVKVYFNTGKVTKWEGDLKSFVEEAQKKPQPISLTKDEERRLQPVPTDDYSGFEVVE